MDLSIRLVASVSAAAPVSGHDFSRATKPAKKSGALAPEGKTFQPDPLAVLILGPTGSGKTALSLALGQRFSGEIVSCDSVAVYRGMDLGSAKPSREEQALLPHHLIDVAGPDQPFTAGDYSRQARTALRSIAARARLPIVTGGTGLYLRALTQGLFAGPQRHEPLRARLKRSAEHHGESWLHRILTRLDSPSAARIHANDTPKLIRAIEVCLTARTPLSQAIAAPGTMNDPLTGFRLLRIGLDPPRTELYPRLNARCQAMFAAGLVDETRNLLARFGPVKALDALGYRQARAVIEGALSADEAIAAAQQGHRNYAKRQMTWFRREPQVHWLTGFGDESAVQQAANELVATAL
ncbi:MAG TPA: tRNA (adenosine(37)-N6)-dimethylallyltransferase MiaA [Terracidiphilus sp.]|jgi:tRNA dimethylallyltransferase|nr:tRNA (adenosine(37)-N6)-dimethylallyltransferase MiaA [Terracidiphilus sp.]